MGKPEVIDLPGWLVPVGCGFVSVFVLLLIGMVALFGWVTSGVFDAAVAHNRAALDAVVADLRAGREPAALAPDGASAEVRAALASSVQLTADDRSGAYVDASHGRTCFAVDTVGPDGASSAWYAVVDSEEGPPAVLLVVPQAGCTCRPTGKVDCSPF